MRDKWHKKVLEHACVFTHAQSKHQHNHLTDSDNWQNPIIGPIPISWPMISATLLQTIPSIWGNRAKQLLELH